MSSPSERKAGLVRQIGIPSAAAIVISNMVGTGIFTTTGFLAGDLGSPALILLIWAVGAVCALAGAFCYSELGINFPASGGEYVYLTEAYGPTWGFMSGWISFFAGFSAPIAAAALAFSDYLGYFFPALKQENAQIAIGSGALAFKIGHAQLAASGLILLLTLLNFLRLKSVAKVQNVLTGSKVVVILGFILLGLFFGSGNWEHFRMEAARTSARPLFSQFAVSLVWIYVGYSGWNAATYIAEELKNPARTLPLALTYGTALVAAMFIGLNIVFIYAAPLEEMKGVVAIGSLAAAKLFGSSVAGIFSALMALSLISTVNAMVTIGPRLYYAMAKNGAFIPIAARVDERRHTPWVAIVCQGACAMLLTLTPFPHLMYYIGFSLNFFAVMAVMSIFVFRRRPGWQKLRVVSFAYPLVPAVFLAVGIWITLYGMTFEPKVSAAAIATIAAGAAVYHFRIRDARRAAIAPRS
ncbi:MAG: amino acid permease [Acidobacteria bacterium]|nr:amino acid permease [Acidobacteriota bacterium]MBI3282439.1 amino acid permease [Acidobacteriota bacterium]